MNTRLSYVAALFITVGTAGAPFAAEDASAGVVRFLRGPVFLLGSGDLDLPLIPGKDILRKLLDGQSLRCGKGGTATLLLNGKERTVTSADGVVRLVSDKMESARKEMLDNLNNFGRAAGGRGVVSMIWSPPDGGAIRAGHLTIKWNAPVDAGPLDIALLDESGERIWSVEGVDSRAGRLPAAQEAEVQQALARHRDDTDAQNITLTAAGKQVRTETRFSILPARTEERLELRLKQWDQDETDPLMRAIGRADALKKALLYTEATEEYEAALAFAPESDTLLQATLEAERKIGNLARVHEIRQKLQAGR
jgi:hypothetical protein